MKMLPLAALATAVAGAYTQWPELKRYLNVRKM
jgi:hypothetical protein